MVWPGSAMTRLTRSVPAGPPQWSRGGWVNTTMSPSRNWCQLKNAFCTRIRSRASSAGTMEVLGIEKTWNTNVRMPNASSSAGARQMAHPAKTRRRDGDASRAASGPPAARTGVPSRRSVAFDQMSAAVGQLVRVRPEVGDPGDQAVVAELEEAQAGLGALRPAELDPARGVPARTDDPLDRDVPVVVEALPVEPEVGLPATHLFPGLRAAVTSCASVMPWHATRRVRHCPLRHRHPPVQVPCGLPVPLRGLLRHHRGRPRHQLRDLERGHELRRPGGTWWAALVAAVAA